MKSRKKESNEENVNNNGSQLFVMSAHSNTIIMCNGVMKKKVNGCVLVMWQ